MEKRFSILRKKDRTPEELERSRRRRQRRLRVLPSLFTMGNAVCGFSAIVHVAAIQIHPVSLVMKNPENLAHAGWLLLLAMLFDALDGRIARMTKSTGDFGGELDSLCDAVSFGVAPALMVVMTNSRVIASGLGHPFWWRVAWLSGLVFVSGTLLRLARFNVETQGHAEDAHLHFKGLPSPAAAGVIASLAILQGYFRPPQDLEGLLAPATLSAIANGISYALPVAALATGWLMVSRVRYVHFANRFLRRRRSPRRLAQLLIGGVVIFALAPQIALTALFVGYAASGPIAGALRRLRGDAPLEDDDEDEEFDDDEGDDDDRDDDAGEERAQGLATRGEAVAAKPAGAEPPAPPAPASAAADA